MSRDTIPAVRQSTAARETGIDTGQLSRMIQQGDVRVIRTTDDLALVPMDEVERLKHETRRRGPKPKDAPPASPPPSDLTLDPADA